MYPSGMKRQARCWICGALFEAERGALAKGARFTCSECVGDGLVSDGAQPPDHATLAKILYERHGVPYFALAHVAVDEDVLRRVPEAFALHHALIPVALRERGTPKTKSKRNRPATALEAVASVDADDGREPGSTAGGREGAGGAAEAGGLELVVAMANPGNTFALETLRRRCGMPIVRCVATWAEIAEAIADQYLRIAIAEGSVPE
jgi:hypothetical protein